MSALVLLSVLFSGQTAPKLSVRGDVARTLNLTNAELTTRFASSVREVSFNLKGEAGKAHVLPLSTLLDAAGMKVDPKRKNSALAFVIVAMAADGYTVTFSAGELIPDVGKREVWVALDWNSKPLADDDAPVRLIVPGDEKPSRWVHGVRTLKVVNLLPKG